MPISWSRLFLISKHSKPQRRRMSAVDENVARCDEVGNGGAKDNGTRAMGH
jgi:hypothetical protein